MRDGPPRRRRRVVHTPSLPRRGCGRGSVKLAIDRNSGDYDVQEHLAQSRKGVGYAGAT